MCFSFINSDIKPLSLDINVLQFKMNENVEITTNHPKSNEIFKSTSIFSTESNTASNRINTYQSLQIKLSIYVLIFYAGLFLIFTHKYELIRLKHIILEFIERNVKHVSFITKIKNIQRNLADLFYNFNITNIQSIFRSFSHTISTIHNFFITTAPNANNLGRLILNNFKTFILLFTNIRQSVSAVSRTFAFSVKKALLFPTKIRNVYRVCAREISTFWRSIEQIIQIVKLPIEILSLIFRFFKGVGDFLHRLEKPKKPKIF
jgi:hypothetical protein